MKRIYVTIILFQLFSWSLSAQNLVRMNVPLTKDTLLMTLEKKDIASRNVLASGQVEFSSTSGYMRILLSNDTGYDLLVYESTPLVAVKGIDRFSSSAMETVNIPSYPSLTKIRVEIKNAKLNNLSVDISNVDISQSQLQKVKTDRMSLINNNLRAQNALWVAGETPVSQMSYEEKKGLFGGSIPDLQGFEYYKGGIFELNNSENTPASTIQSAHSMTTSTSNNYVSAFDWRSRHGANNPSSPYYNANGNGWITPVKDQGNCGACWAFAGIGAIEAITNLYFNRFINPDLSEQELVSCTSTHCNGGYVALAYNYAKNNGIIDELSFPYQNAVGNCNDKPTNSNEKIKINGYTDYWNLPASESEIKAQLIQFPVAVDISPMSHAMVMVGYKTIEAGDTIFLKYSWSIGTNWVIIEDGDPRIGKTAWLMKNSYGTSWGDDGYCYLIMDNIGYALGTFSKILMPITSLNYTNANIVCEDHDGDGYYFWGIGPKPASCPANVPDEPDGDDSNPTLGPMNNFGYCRPLTHLSLRQRNSYSILPNLWLTKSTGETLSSVKGPTSCYVIVY